MEAFLPWGGPACRPHQPLPSCTQYSSGLGLAALPRGRGVTPLPLPLEKGWPSLFTGSQRTIPLLFVFAKQWAPASAGRRASDVAGINSCECVNNDFPGGDQAPNSAPIHPQVPVGKRARLASRGTPQCALQSHREEERVVGLPGCYSLIEGSLSGQVWLGK